MEPNITPRDHIDRIKNEFGIKDRKSDSLHNSIHELAADLYSKDVHFILELIQNAEDNKYSGVEPKLVFYLLDNDPTNTPNTQGALMVVNNEIGFRYDNVEAICAVGKSTKTKHEGYIGEKGIGFKSVFIISERPHIISGGYQFNFQETPDPVAGLGYIVPYWVPKTFPELIPYSGKTCILLPIKANKRQQLESQLRQIAPETILFLRRLSALKIQYQEQTILEVCRDDQKKPLVEFLDNQNGIQYWLFDQNCPVPESLHEEKRKEVTTRIVSIAFPLNHSGKLPHEVFAFLPTNERSGFDFLINADFILLGNREFIQERNDWNQWLRDCITQTFINAFMSLLENPAYMFKPYLYIPIGNTDRGEFFQPVAEEIIEQIKLRPIIWTLDGQTLNEPTSVRFASEDFRDLVKDGRFPEQLKITPFVHPELEKEVYAAKLKTIGVKSITEAEIIKCLKDTTWTQNRSSEWYYDLYVFLAKQKWTKPEKLREIELLPLVGGGLSSSNNPPRVYIPSEESVQFLKGNNQIILYLDIKFLDNHLFNLIIEHDKNLMEWLKETLNLLPLDIPMICQELAIKLGSDLRSIDSKTLIWATDFIRVHYQELADNQKTVIKNNLPLLLNNEKIIKPEEWIDEKPLVVPEKMDSKTGWQLVFLDEVDRINMEILSDAYLGQIKDRKEQGEWLKFFLSIGATHAPSPRRWPMKFDGYKNQNPVDVSSHVKKIINEQRNKRYWSKHSYEGHDFAALEWLRTLFKNPETKPSQKTCIALIKWFEIQQGSAKPPSWQAENKYWLSQFENERAEGKIEYPWKKAEFRWIYRTQYSDTFDSEFMHLIRTCAWFPSTQGFKRPSEVFIDKPEIREFFGDSLPYTKIQLSSGVTALLGLHTSATVEQILSLLQDLARQPAIHSTQDLSRKIYEFLADRWKGEFKRNFVNQALILSLQPEPVWIGINQAIWLDLPSGFENFGYIDISKQYGGRLHDFFVKQLGVIDSLDDETYAQAWINLSQQDHPTANKVEAALERIYPVILKAAKLAKSPKWWDNFTTSLRFWTQSDQFVPAPKVFIPDDGELQRKMGKAGVEFVWRPAKDSFSDYLPLYRALGVRSLVENVEITAKVMSLTNLSEGNEQFLITKGTKKAVCHYLRNDHRTNYEQLKTSAILEVFLTTKEVVVDQLDITFSLDGKVIYEKNGIAFWDRQKRVLYLSHNHSRDELETEVPSALARRMVNMQIAKDFEDFIGRMLGASEEKVNGIIDKRNWGMPQEEDQWIEHILGSIQIPQSPEPTNIKPTGLKLPEPPSSKPPDLKPPKQPGSKLPFFPGLRPPKKPRKKQTKPPEWRPRLVSYVEQSAGNSDNIDDDPRTERGKLIGDAGINKVKKYEESQGRMKARYLGQTHKGWDIDSEEAESEGVDAILGKKIVRRIEVKSKEGEWDGWGISLTAEEYKAALEYGDDYYLYVVEYALDPNATQPPFIFRNPVKMITEYRFDYQWKKLSINEGSAKK